MLENANVPVWLAILIGIIPPAGVFLVNLYNNSRKEKREDNKSALDLYEKYIERVNSDQDRLRKTLEEIETDYFKILKENTSLKVELASLKKEKAHD